MPQLNIEMFDEAPAVGDAVTVTGKVLSINEETGDVEVSYDEVVSKSTENKEGRMSEKGETVDESLAKFMKEESSSPEGL